MNEQFEREIADILESVKKLLIRKHNNYGDMNLYKHGHIGILIRLSDKLARLERLIENPSAIEGEACLISEIEKAIKDTYMDMAGYAVQGVRMLEERRKESD